jgi:hypothetical protein
VVALGFLAIGVGDADAQQPAGQPGGVLIAGRVHDSVTNAALRGVAVEIRYLAADSLRVVGITDDSGRFTLRAPRRDVVQVVARRVGYEPFWRNIRLGADTLLLAIALTRIAQPLAPVVVEQSDVDLVLRDIRRELRWNHHTPRIYDQRALEKSKQLMTGAFLLAQGGIARVPCQRNAQFLPEGKVRTQPVEHEPADLFWPCTMVRGKPRSVLVSVDGGPATEFNAISARNLGEFAMVVVSNNNRVIAYTKLYVEHRARARRAADRD